MRSVLSLLVCCCLVSNAWTQETETSQQKRVRLVKKLNDNLLLTHNRERSRNGRRALVLDKRLTDAAQKHADWMANSNRLSHTGRNGSSPSRRVGSGFGVIGENIAYGQSGYGEVTRSWMNSGGHRSNILGGYNAVGFGAAKSKSGRIYWCAVFSRCNY
tara:strand:- start:1437 stop:1913 length:477 start_codon:yes stop_codon:yes gene_type:complete